VDSSHNVARISLTPYIIREHRLYLWVDTISFYAENKSARFKVDTIVGRNPIFWTKKNYMGDATAPHTPHRNADKLSGVNLYLLVTPSGLTLV
jgi:hypothetical protein